jgi:hypothetical protein
MVRAVKLEETPSGSYYNPSQGIFQSLDGTVGAVQVVLTEPTNRSVFVAPAAVEINASTLDLSRRIARMEFYADEVRLGKTPAPPFRFTWSNAPAGSYSITARAVCHDDQFVTSSIVTVRVDAPLVAPGAVWKYLDDGSDQGTVWRAVDFDDRAWAAGPAELGYSNSPVTVVSFGSDPTNKYITTWFRRAFTVSDPGLWTNLTLGVLRDDGAVVFLNGTEVFRSNMPNGPIHYRTLASSDVSGANEARYYVTPVNPALLVAGTNVLAVEVHQSATNSPDLGFNLFLNGSAVPVRPTLAIAYRTNQVRLSWPASPFGFRLEATYALPAPNWASVTETVQMTNGVNSVTLDVAGEVQFFRLVGP